MDDAPDDDSARETPPVDDGASHGPAADDGSIGEEAMGSDEPIGGDRSPGDEGPSTDGQPTDDDGNVFGPRPDEPRRGPILPGDPELENVAFVLLGVATSLLIIADLVGFL